jgi:DNA-binding beta-propeller fold protein YncE
VSLAVDGRGRVYVLDRHAGRVSVFGRDGGFLHHFAGQGWREGRLHYPSYIAAGRDGRVFVVDAQNARVSVFE